MTAGKTNGAGPMVDSVSELLEQRTQVQGWLESLEKMGQTANPRVVSRVRDDYSSRLQAILEQLRQHLEALRDSHAERRKIADELEQKHERAIEALEEMRLRHLIGEVPLEEWERSEKDLSTEVETAAKELETTRAELSRLDELLEQIGGAEVRDEWDFDVDDEHNGSQGSPDAQDAPALQSGGDRPSPSVGGEQTDQDLILAEPLAELDAAGTVNDATADARPAKSAGRSPRTAGAGPKASAAMTPDSSSDDDRTVEDPSPGDIDFLLELDRAIAGSENEPATADDQESSLVSGLPDEENPENFKPAAGTKCPDCGYTNDADAWYCGVCGVDLV